MSRLLSYVAAACTALAPLGASAAQGDGAAAPPPRDDRGLSADSDPRTALGMTVVFSGNERDTLGVLVSTLTPGGPADRAGIDEGSRVAAVNGVSLRVDPAAVGQRPAADAVLRRLTRALRSLHPGDEVTLRTYRGGRFHTVTLRTAGGSGDGVPASAPSAARRAPPGPPAVPNADAAAGPRDSSAEPPTLAGVLDAIGRLRAQLLRLEEATESPALADSLAQAERELGDLRRRLRDADVRQRRRGAPAADADADDGAGAARRRVPASDDGEVAEGVPGLRLTTVDEALSSYLGDESEGGLLVLQADATWSPIRKGDVILRLNGGPADAESLRAARESARASRVDVLRRGRVLSLTLRPRD